ncbi:hypothetical protein FB565_008000 [Actinoplanes lutulentus]|uniref:Uncharacterized protein n=1 Tax=Actinoplanes lutulentus TaxID=1287878 RepID=A0A327Z6B4_9ACTN|nr:hypothetical protein [Actinoplanes lutulentus]MBB2948217.1 hypothetical protein [Actinoplanes lutulentus]RAK31284.1 hypothetical protein B0I29_11590 [Actinoplanes lutulentus]
MTAGDWTGAGNDWARVDAAWPHTDGQRVSARTQSTHAQSTRAHSTRNESTRSDSPAGGSDGEGPADDGWPQADPGLERAYKRLLRTYPPGYRQRHEPEIMTTLLEMAEPGQQRPSRAESWHLIASGIRQRFRLPAGWPLAWVAAVLVALIGGGFGAAAGSWTAEQTFADIPGQATVGALHEQVLGRPGDDTSVQPDSGSPWWGRMVMVNTSVLGFDGWDAEQARQRLAADGWRLGPTTHPAGSATTTDEQGNDVEMELRRTEFRAERDGVVLEVDSHQTEQSGMVGTRLWSAGNATLLPFTVIGMLAGLTVGWLFAAAGVQWLRHAAPARAGLGAALAAVTVVVLTLPAVAFYGNVMRAFRYAGGDDAVFTVHSAVNPGAYWPFGPEWLNLALAVAGLGLAAAVLILTWAARSGARGGAR